MENQIVIYQTDNGQTAIDVRLENDTVWLTQAQMAQLFQKDRTVIGRHIRNVYKEGELNEIGTCAKIAYMTSQTMCKSCKELEVGKVICKICKIVVVAKYANTIFGDEKQCAYFAHTTARNKNIV